MGAKKREIDRLAKRIEELEVERDQLQGAVRAATEIAAMDRDLRVAAQRGLVPYVQAVEQLNKWLAANPDLEPRLTPVLKELGLYGVRVGYNPDKDRGLTEDIRQHSRFNKTPVASGSNGKKGPRRMVR